MRFALLKVLPIILAHVLKTWNLRYWILFVVLIDLKLYGLMAVVGILLYLDGYIHRGNIDVVGRMLLRHGLVRWWCLGGRLLD